MEGASSSAARMRSQPASLIWVNRVVLPRPIFASWPPSCFRLTHRALLRVEPELELSDADAELAHRRGVVVVTTLVGAPKLEKEARAQQDALNARNLRRLLGHRVRLALGGDSYRQDSEAEALCLDSLHVLSPSALLKLWTESTAAAVYPDRRIGRLREGFEASFLVLAGDPLRDFGQVTQITRRVKQGRALP